MKRLILAALFGLALVIPTAAQANVRFYVVPAQPACSGTTPNIHEYVNGCQLFNSGSWVNTALPAGPPIDSSSASMVAKFSSQIGVDSNGSLVSGASGGLRWLDYSDTYVTNSTDRSTWKTVCSREVLNNTSWSWMNDLHNAWVTFKTPVPTNMPYFDGGSDHGSEVYNAPTGEMWDFFVGPDPAPAGTTDPQGHVCDYIATGGDYQHFVPTSPGYFITQPLGSGVNENSMWGRSASALPEIAGNITPEEWNNPLPDFGHTLNMVVPWADPTKQYWPAERHDGGSGGLGGLPEGARVRIDPSVTCPHGTAGSTGPTQLAYDRAYAICATLQKYGAVVYDQTGNGAAFGLTYPVNGKPFTRTPDGGNCCNSNTTPGSGTQWPNWYWDVSLIHVLPHLQVIAQSYRPPYAPLQ